MSSFLKVFRYFRSWERRQTQDQSDILPYPYETDFDHNVHNAKGINTDRVEIVSNVIRLVIRRQIHSWSCTGEFCLSCSWNYVKWYSGVYPKVSGLSHNEIYAYNNRHSSRGNTKGYGGKTHYTDSQNSDISAHRGRELYHLQFSLQAASPETFGYTLLYYTTKASV
jgi:hypothetical protein